MQARVVLGVGIGVLSVASILYAEVHYQWLDQGCLDDSVGGQTLTLAESVRQCVVNISN